MARDTNPTEHAESALHALGVQESGKAAEVAVAALMDEYDIVPKHTGLTVKVGPHTNDVQVMLDGVNIAPQLRIASIEFAPMVANEITRATLTLYTKAEVELLPEGVNVIVTDPNDPAYDTSCKNCGKPAMIIAGVCSVECMEQIDAGDKPVEEGTPYTGPVRKP